MTPSQPPSSELKAFLDPFSRLPGEERDLLLLVAVDGYSYQAAAARLGIALPTVTSRLARARRRLRAPTGRHTS